MVMTMKNDDDELINHLAWRGGGNNTSSQPVVIRWYVRNFFVLKAYQRGLCVSL